MFKLNRLCLRTARCLQQTKTFTQSVPRLCKAIPAATSTKQPNNAVDLKRHNLECLGQPTSETHPHLIRPNELVPGLSLSEFQQRRSRLMLSIREYALSFGSKFNERASTNHIVIVSGAPKKYMSGKIPYVFRQNSDFYYLTGCLEPDAALMLTIDETATVKSTLFVRPKDAHAELWDGPRTGPHNAVHHFGVDEAYSFDAFKEHINKQAAVLKSILWCDLKSTELPSVKTAVEEVHKSEQAACLPVHTFLEGMRLIKSAAEMQLMRHTCEIASRAFNEVIAATRPGQSEHHLYAAMDYKCRIRNASYLAYPPVVAAGKNATIIHYINNTQLMQSNELVLVDAGCEYAGYTSDITRTWPVNGVFTPTQRTLYEMLAQLQKECIELLRQTGGETLDQLFETTCFKLGKYLQELGLVPKDVTAYNDFIKHGYKFCPHHVSHYLGMDVHDTPHMPRTMKLQEGMVFTVEPGIYISETCTDVPREFRGIGIRIEDDILINEQGKIEVLTATCAKERHTLENLFKQKSAKVEVNSKID